MVEVQVSQVLLEILEGRELLAQQVSLVSKVHRVLMDHQEITVSKVPLEMQVILETQDLQGRLEAQVLQASTEHLEAKETWVQQVFQVSRVSLVLLVQLVFLEVLVVLVTRV